MRDGALSADVVFLSDFCVYFGAEKLIWIGFTEQKVQLDEDKQPWTGNMSTDVIELSSGRHIYMC